MESITSEDIAMLIGALLIVARYAAKFTDTDKDDAIVKRATTAAKKVIG